MGGYGRARSIYLRSNARSPTFRQDPGQANADPLCIRLGFKLRLEQTFTRVPSGSAQLPRYGILIVSVPLAPDGTFQATPGDTTLYTFQATPSGTTRCTFQETPCDSSFNADVTHQGGRMQRTAIRALRACQASRWL
eukprot:gene18825-25371_t